MKEKTLLKAALIITLVGLAVLYLISGSIEIEETNMEKITLQNKGDFVKIKGTVSNKVDAGKITILDITQPHEITVILIKRDNKTIQINHGNEVEIIGKVDEYNGKMEIIADKVRVIR